VGAPSPVWTDTSRASVMTGSPRISPRTAGTTPWSSSDACRPQRTRSAPPVWRI